MVETAVSEKRKVPVNRVIPFSSVDGPGSRTAVFLQGCNIDCKYCHNPETRNLCRSCGDCVDVCPEGALFKDSYGNVRYDRDKCVFCDTCIETCSFGSSPRILMLDAAETFSLIRRQVPFIRGVTVSGGECMLYPDFLRELFEACKEIGLHTLIDSNGTVDFSHYSDLLEVTDGVMLDIKAYDPEDYRRVTGGENDIVLKNASFLAEHGKLYEVRTVVVPGLFDAMDTVQRSARLLAPFTGGEKPDILYKLITYRENGVRSCYRIWQPPQKAFMEQLAEAACREGMERTVIV